MNHIARDLSAFDVEAFLDKAGKAVDTAATVAKDPSALLQRVTIRTAYTAPISYTGAQLEAMAKAPKQPGSKSILERLQPTIEVATPYGSKTIAPYGVVPADAWKKNTFKLIGLFLGGLALYTAGGYYLGYKAGQRRAARGG